MTQPRLTIVPCSFANAKRYVNRHHRHHGAPVRVKFQIAVADEDGTIRGVAMVGRPVARHLDDGQTLEVNRVATDGCENACSALYGAARRVAREMGYAKLITYILEDEPGISLKAAGWTFEAITGPMSWNVPGRPRVDKTAVVPRGRWSVELNPRRVVSWPEAPDSMTESLFAALSLEREE